MKKGQIWVETVIYTLIGIILIGMVIGFAKPAIEKQKDKILVEGSIDSLNEIDSKILEVNRMGPSNSREISLSIKKGYLKIDAKKDELIFLIDNSKYAASETGRVYNAKINISGTNLQIMTEDAGDKYKISILRSFDFFKINLTYKEKDEDHIFNIAVNPYSLVIENKGKQDSGAIQINIYENS